MNGGIPSNCVACIAHCKICNVDPAICDECYSPNYKVDDGIVNNDKKCHCDVGYYMYQGNCLDVCPDGYYGASGNRTCTKCPPNCKTCNTATECKTCSANYYLNGDDWCVCTAGWFIKDDVNFECTTDCGVYLYGDDSTYTCADCAAECKICSGSLNTECSSCRPGSYLTGFTC